MRPGSRWCVLCRDCRQTGPYLDDGAVPAEDARGLEDVLILGHFADIPQAHRLIVGGAQKRAADLPTPRQAISSAAPGGRWALRWAR